MFIVWRHCFHFSWIKLSVVVNFEYIHGNIFSDIFKIILINKMAFSLKYQKEIEADIHEQLYSNIFILTLSYPTTKEFNAQFKQGMFVKNNKTAFQHVVHFLLNILDPSIFAKKTISWPILDVKMESQFRNEVMKYLNELNSSNKETGIPLIMTSHLISPGGYKFAEFMFRLSQFVLAEHIRRTNISQNIIFPPTASSDYAVSSDQLHILNKIVDDQYNKLVENQAEFQSKLDYAKNRSKHLLEQKTIHDQNAKQTEQKINDFLKSHEDNISDIYQKNVSDREAEIERMFNKLDEYKHQLKKCSELLDILSENKNIVKLKRVDYEDTETVVENFKQKNNKDLLEHFQSLAKTLKNKSFILKNRKDPNFSEYLQITADIYNDLMEYTSKYEELIAEFHIFKTEMELNTKEYDNNSVVSQKVREIFDVIPQMNIYTQN